ncbi:hypothetical protein B0T26DRAFT_373686 [Lasiosphaeria miniovina]|uniref:Uncharacterized protein n=1 Tax=Lasiosphaeria miniovina TaxID=1954250 RepID=A0AA40ADL8_9PEZI|nr:uncharacterized protein B0T26DRAFT_373686 [Lasiosphaeria miniovina]KAK0713814.1 hypothetical protein B0T26DRAFT_373686 [Lasiosphaeria miniovina]
MVCAGECEASWIDSNHSHSHPKRQRCEAMSGFLICHDFFPGRRPHNCSRIRKSCPRINRMMSSEGISTESGERRRDGPLVRARWELAEQAQPYVMHACMRWTLGAGHWALDAGRWMLDAGCWTLDAGRWMLDAGCIDARRGHVAFASKRLSPRHLTRPDMVSGENKVRVVVMLAAGSRAELSHPRCRITFRRAAKLIGVASIGLQLALFIGQSSEDTQQTGLVIPGPGRKNTRFQNSKLSL